MLYNESKLRLQRIKLVENMKQEDIKKQSAPTLSNYTVTLATNSIQTHLQKAMEAIDRNQKSTYTKEMIKALLTHLGIFKLHTDRTARALQHEIAILNKVYSLLSNKGDAKIGDLYSFLLILYNSTQSNVAFSHIKELLLKIDKNIIFDRDTQTVLNDLFNIITTTKRSKTIHTTKRGTTQPKLELKKIEKAKEDRSPAHSNTFIKLFNKHCLLEQNLITLKRIEEDKQCTFAPKINDNTLVGTHDDIGALYFTFNPSTMCESTIPKCHKNDIVRFNLMYGNNVHEYDISISSDPKKAAIEYCKKYKLTCCSYIAHQIENAIKQYVSYL